MAEIILNEEDVEKFSQLTGTPMNLVKRQFSIDNVEANVLSLQDHRNFLSELFNKGYKKQENFSDYDYRINGDITQHYYDFMFDKLKSKGEDAIVYVLTDPGLFKAWQLIEDFQTGWFKASRLSKKYYIHICSNLNNFKVNPTRFIKKIENLSLNLHWFLIKPELKDPNAPKYPINNHELMLRIIEKTGFSAFRHPEIFSDLSETWNLSGFTNKATKALNRFYLDMSKEKDRRKWLAYILINKIMSQGIGLNVASILVADYLYLKTGTEYKPKTFEINYSRYRKEYKEKNFNEGQLIKDYDLKDDLNMGFRFSIINFDYNMQVQKREEEY